MKLIEELAIRVLFLCQQNSSFVDESPVLRLLFRK